VDEQDRQHHPLLASAQVDRPIAVEHLKRSEDPELHAPPPELVAPSS